MLIEVVAGLVGLGLAVWIIGELFDNTGIAVIGSTILIVAGSAVALTGLELRVGETRHYNYTTIHNSTVRDSASIQYTYQTRTLATIMHVGAIAPLGIGGLLMLLGATLMAQSLSDEVA